jgi:hypothetical protein
MLQQIMQRNDKDNVLPSAMIRPDDLRNQNKKKTNTLDTEQKVTHIRHLHCIKLFTMPAVQCWSKG